MGADKGVREQLVALRDALRQTERDAARVTPKQTTIAYADPHRKKRSALSIDARC